MGRDILLDACQYVWSPHLITNYHSCYRFKVRCVQVDNLYFQIRTHIFNSFVLRVNVHLEACVRVIEGAHGDHILCLLCIALR